MIERLMRALDLIGPRDRLVKVRSWRPAVDRYRGRLEVTWPVLLVDCISYRATVAPVWDAVRLKGLFLKATGRA